MNVLVVNAGSSSLKYQLFNTSTDEVLAKGLCDRIGIEGSKIEHKNITKGTKTVKETPMSDHSVAMQLVVDMLTDAEVGSIKSMDEIEAVGHRVVHGGSYFSKSILLNDDVLAKLELCRDFAPLHTPAAITGIKACLAVMANKPQVLVFDTAFHQTMEPKAYMYALPYEYYEKYGIRRYGFHGSSHRYVSAEMAKLLDKPLEETKIVTCHIGNGSSISAVKGGKVVDTTMGFTPLAGVEMGTRCGDIDPAIVTFLMEKENLSPAEINAIMNKKSGFIGVTEFSSDSRDIEDTLKAGESAPHYERCKLANDILVYQIKKYIGAYAAAMNGLDAVVFTAGIGENNGTFRNEICSDMEYLGIEIDEELDKTIRGSAGITKVSKDSSKVAVYMIPTNEELVIARDTEELAKTVLN